MRIFIPSLIGYGTLAAIWWALGDTALVIASIVSLLLLWQVDRLTAFLDHIIARKAASQHQRQQRHQHLVRRVQGF